MLFVYLAGQKQKIGFFLLQTVSPVILQKKPAIRHLLSSPNKITNQVSNAKPIHPVGFINSSKACYANSILEILRAVSTF